MLCAICLHPSKNPSEINSPILFCFVKSFSLSGPSVISAADGSAAGNCCSWNPSESDEKCRTWVCVFCLNLCSGSLQGFFYTFIWHTRYRGNGRQQWFWNYGLESHRKWSFMVKQAIVGTRCCKLISSVKFHCWKSGKSSCWQWLSHPKVWVY